ncbi:MAG: hypothetical protein KJ559_03460 [Nanoarchaeota archaeon]|nr:hypothetical protein [Nanoarchaeota archaeon]
MKIIGFNFKKINIEKKDKLKSKLEIKSNIKVNSISEEKLDIVKDQSALKFEFEFSVDYSPDFAKINLEGFILVLLEKDVSKEILKKWKTKKISNDIRIPIFNTILTKCNLRALQFEDEFVLPPHIPMPKLSSEDSQKTYTG